MIKTMTMIWADHVAYMTQMSSVYHNIPMKNCWEDRSARPWQQVEESVDFKEMGFTGVDCIQLC